MDGSNSGKIPDFDNKISNEDDNQRHAIDIENAEQSNLNQSFYISKDFLDSISINHKNKSFLAPQKDNSPVILTICHKKLRVRHILYLFSIFGPVFFLYIFLSLLSN